MIQLPAYFSNYRRRKDRTASLTFSTQEISSEDLKLIDELVMTESFGFLLFKESEIQVGDIPEEDPKSDDISPSKRLRNRLYVYHKEKNIKENFNQWYAAQLEKLGQKYLDLLN